MIKVAKGPLGLPESAFSRDTEQSASAVQKANLFTKLLDSSEMLRTFEEIVPTQPPEHQEYMQHSLFYFTIPGSFEKKIKDKETSRPILKEERTLGLIYFLSFIAIHAPEEALPYKGFHIDYYLHGKPRKTKETQGLYTLLEIQLRSNNLTITDLLLIMEQCALDPTRPNQPSLRRIRNTIFY